MRDSARPALAGHVVKARSSGDCGPLDGREARNYDGELMWILSPRSLLVVGLFVACTEPEPGETETESSSSGAGLTDSPGTTSGASTGGPTATSEAPPTTGAASTGAASTGGPADEPLAAGIEVTAVEVNQGVGIAVVAGGVPLDADQFVAPVIGGRPALIRAGYALADGFAPRVVEAYLDLERVDATVVRHTASRTVEGPADMTTLDGTFAWHLDAEAMKDVAGFRVSLHEQAGAPPDDGVLPGASVPAEGFAALGAWHDRMVLDVMVVPFSCQGTDPVDVSGEDLADMEAYLFNTYPVQELKLTVHAPVESASCDEFEAAEFDLPDLRVADGAPPHVYYGGLLPGDGGGYSISIEGGDQMDYRRTFANHTWRWYGLTFDLFAHELGHNHGRDHTFEDPSYPGESAGNCGTIDTWGHGVRPGSMPQCGYSNDQEIGIPWLDANAMLVPPTNLDPCDGLPEANRGSYSDFMSYAYPYWISAYTYRAIAERVKLISTWDQGAPPADEGAILRVLVSPEGAVRWTRTRGALSVRSSAGVARCVAPGGALVRLPVRRGAAIHDQAIAPGELRSWRYTTLEVPLARGFEPSRCEIEVEGHRVELALAGP